MALCSAEEPNKTPSGTMQAHLPPTFSILRNKARNNSSVFFVLHTFKNRISHIFCVGAFLIPMKIFNKGKYNLLNNRVHLSCGKIMEYTPLQLTSFDFTAAALYFPIKNAFMRQSNIAASFACILSAQSHQEDSSVLLSRKFPKDYLFYFLILL